MHCEFNTRFLNLTEDQQADLKRWRKNITEGNDQVGLWVYGDHGSGSSYIARCALHRLVLDNPAWDWEYFSALQVMDAMRNLWTLSKQLGPQADPELVQEQMLIDQEFRFLWEKAHIILLDDLFDSLDINFWRAHVHDNIDRRVKEHRPTIIATTMSPNHRLFADVQRVIEHWFVVCRATR